MVCSKCFVVCQQQQFRSVFSLSGQQLIRLVHLFVSCDTVAFRHCVLGKSWLWLFLLGPAPFALFLCWMAKRISGWGICVSPFAVWVCCFVCVCDLPTYMTTGVHVDVILTCLFSCKDRASERYRPHQKEKKL